MNKNYELQKQRIESLKQACRCIQAIDQIAAQRPRNIVEDIKEEAESYEITEDYDAYAEVIDNYYMDLREILFDIAHEAGKGIKELEN